MDVRALARRCADASDDDADDACAATVASACARDRETMLRAVMGVESILCGTDARARRRATSILAAATARCVDDLDARGVDALCGFFGGRLGDHASCGAAARGAAASARRASERAVEEVSRALFTDARPQSLRQSDRESCLGLANALMREERTARACARGAGEGDFGEAVARMVSAFDGEKDPRCVLALGEFWELMPRAFELCGEAAMKAYEENAEELYDVAASYFPVSFKPPRGDSVKISRRQLAEAVERAMTASPSFAPWAISHALESLNPSLGPGKMADAARAVRAMGEKWGRRVMEEYLDLIWRSMRAALSHPNATKMEEDDDPRATTPMAVMTTMFASDFGGGALSRAALTDQSVRDAEAALRRLASETASKGTCSMEVDGSDGCCGGGCGSGGDDDATTGRVVAASASRVLGAVAAATPALACEVIQVTLKRILDAAQISSDSTASKAAYASLILATPAIGGALDCCERNAETGVRVSVMGDESDRLVRLFSSAALGEINAQNVSEVIILGLAGLHMMCKFPSGFGLASETARVAVTSNLLDAIVCDHADESEDDVDIRIERAVDALVAAVSHGDEKLTAAVSTGTVLRLADKISVDNVRSVSGERAIRTLVAIAHANEAIRSDVARLFCDVTREALSANNFEAASDLINAMCRDDDGVLTRFMSGANAQTACETLVDFCLDECDTSGSFAANGVRVVASAMANCNAEAQARLAARAFDIENDKPEMSCAVICGLRPDVVFDVSRLQDALKSLVDRATTSTDHGMRAQLVAAACGSVVRKFPNIEFAMPSQDLSNQGVVLIHGACMRARVMRRDVSPEFEAVVSRLITALDVTLTNDTHAAKGAARALGMAVGFDAEQRMLALGLRPCTHANEMFLANQRFFTKIAPVLIASARGSVGEARLFCSYAATKLAGGVPASVALNEQFDLFPFLSDVLIALTTGSLGHDVSSTRTALDLVSARLSNPALGGGADVVELHAVSLIQALCDIAVERDGTMTMDIRDRALDALFASSTLKFSVTFPVCDRALQAAEFACDDPKRRVRRSAARARQAWIALSSK